MGTVSSKDTRRISFDNTFAVPALSVKSIEDDHVLDLDAITAVTQKNDDDDLIFPEGKNAPVVKKEEKEVDYWANRIDALKQEHRLINKIIETEYEKTLERTSMLIDRRGTETFINKIKPCFEWRTKIIQCYEANPHQPLLCSSIVKAFNECVSSCRMQE